MSNDTTQPKKNRYLVTDCLCDIQGLIEKITKAKPNDRSAEDRKFAIVITDLEKIEAYFAYQIMGLGLQPMDVSADNGGA